MEGTTEKAQRNRKRDPGIKRQIKHMTKDQLAAAISKKRECNARAMMVVERSIEPVVDVTWLLKNLKHINQSHFQDIVEERAISSICGYPLCVTGLIDVPKKRFKISTRENKVYDITDRKNYCSNKCYKAGTFLKDQLYCSPLWLRDCEEPVVFRVLSSPKSGTDGVVGDEIDLGIAKPIKLKKAKADKNLVLTSESQNKSSTNTPKTEEFVCEPDRATSSLCAVKKIETEQKNLNLLTTPSQPIIQPLSDAHSSNLSQEEDNANITTTSSSNNVNITTTSSSNNANITTTSSSNNVNITTTSSSNSEDSIQISENTVSNTDNKVEAKKGKTAKDKMDEPVPLNAVNDIEQKIASWFTIDSMIYLLGPEKVRELLKMYGLNEDIAPKKNDQLLHLKTQEIYKKLNILELKEKEKQEPLKPVPDYETLKQEAKDIEIKAKSFLRGDAKVTFADEENEYFKLGDMEDVSLPLIDHCEFLSARQRIFLDMLTKVLADIQNALDLSQFRLGWEINELVSTFKLGPTNILMKPFEWTLIAVIVIKLLTIHNEILNYAYSREVTQKRLITYLLTYDLDGGYPDRFTTYLMDIERLTSSIDIK